MTIDYINKTFNNREIALIFYLLIFIIWALTKKNIRESIKGVIKTLFEFSIVISIALLVVYVFSIVCLLYLLQFWDMTMIKDTAYWTFGVGFILMMNSNKVSKQENYFIKIVKDNFKLMALVQFIVGLYVFGLVTELILMPILTFLSMLLAYTEAYKEHKQVKRFLQAIFSIVGIAYLIYSAVHIYQDFKNFASYSTFKAFSFPIVMTCMFIPFAYIYALYINYETLFVRLSLSLNGKKGLATYAKWRMLVSVNFSFEKLRKLTPGFLFGGCLTKADIDKEIKSKLNL